MLNEIVLARNPKSNKYLLVKAVRGAKNDTLGIPDRKFETNKITLLGKLFLPNQLLLNDIFYIRMQNFVIENVFRKLYGTLIGKKIRLLGFLISKMSIIHNNQLTIRLPSYSCLQEIPFYFIHSIKTFTENWDSKRHLLERSWPV